jgi:hypothetical protein
VQFLVGFLVLLSTSLWAARAKPADSAKLAELNSTMHKLVVTPITASTAHLSARERKALHTIIAAAKHLDPLYLRQVWSGNAELKSKLHADDSRRGKLNFALFKQNVGPWLRLEKDAPFIEGVPAHKPPTAGFYPQDMTREEFEAWAKTLSPADRAKAVGFFWVVTRNKDGKLQLVPYSETYKEFLEPAAKLLKQAAEETRNASLRSYLNLRAAAFSSDDYYASDMAWMDLQSPIEVTIGPYETYEDELFSYKAAFESFVTIRNDAETGKLEKFSGHLQELENNLPIDAKYRNPKLGALAPIRVVDQVFASGDARRGVMTAAFNLPNDDRVIKEKGSKRVMIKNVQESKFHKVLQPISHIVLEKKHATEVQFAPFFTHILMHELMHGLGPHSITVDGKESTPRAALKELHSAIEEAKADITGLWAMQYLMDKGVIDSSMQRSMYTTFLASAFRSVRFGINEAHGKGTALQFNYLMDEGGILANANGTFEIVPSKIKAAVTKLTGELLTLEAEGSYAKADAFLKKYAVIRPEMEKTLAKLGAIPVDIDPRYPMAGE